MQISLIAAVAQNGVIGKENKLIWHLSEDLKRFKRLTSGHILIMGRKTYEHLPIRPLPNRKNIVLTRQSIDYQGAYAVGSVEAAFELCSSDSKVFVAGGAEIYRLFLPFATHLYLTEIHKSFEGDTFFPDIDYAQFKLTDSEFLDGDLPATFKYYERISLQ